jgi:8-oxo-dGTP pyrophosphatase MutT (NUDIX family)
VVFRRVLPNEADERDMTLTAQALRDLAALRLRATAPPTWDHSDDDMNQKARMIPAGVKPKAAAVLIGISEQDDGLKVLLTQRHAGLKKHAGQIAFPGGRLDEGESPLAAALREAHEETGLAPEFVEPLGYLDGYLTVTAFFVTPVVAFLKPGFSLAAQADEVEDIFDVPLSFLLDVKNRETHARDWSGISRQYYAYTFGQRYIWGATAGMIKNLGERLDGTKA